MFASCIFKIAISKNIVGVNRFCYYFFHVNTANVCTILSNRN